MESAEPAAEQSEQREPVVVVYPELWSLRGRLVVDAAGRAAELDDNYDDEQRQRRWQEAQERDRQEPAERAVGWAVVGLLEQLPAGGRVRDRLRRRRRARQRLRQGPAFGQGERAHSLLPPLCAALTMRRPRLLTENYIPAAFQ